MASKTFLSLLFGLIPIITAQQCPIQFEGRVAPNTTLATFDTSASLFSPSFVFGQSIPSSQISGLMQLTCQDLTWSKILQLPSLNSSLVCRSIPLKCYLINPPSLMLQTTQSRSKSRYLMILFLRHRQPTSRQDFDEPSSSLHPTQALIHRHLASKLCTSL
jgi:hypothetical protein